MFFHHVILIWSLIWHEMTFFIWSSFACWYKNYRLRIKKKIFMKVFCHISWKGFDKWSWRRRVKSNIHAKVQVMSLGRDWIIVQNARSFCQLALTLCDKTTIIHAMADKIDTYKLEDPFADPVINKRYYLNGYDQFEWGDHSLVTKFKTWKVW